MDLLLALQVAAQTAAQTATATVDLAKDTNSLGTSAIVSAATAYAIQMLKRASWFPVVSATSQKWWLISFSGLVALATSLGVHWTYDATVGTLAVTGLVPSALYEHAVDWFRSFVLQQLTYDVAINKDRPPSITKV